MPGLKSNDPWGVPTEVISFAGDVHKVKERAFLDAREIVGIRVTEEANKGYMTYDSAGLRVEVLMHPDDVPSGTMWTWDIPVRWDSVDA